MGIFRVLGRTQPKRLLNVQSNVSRRSWHSQFSLPIEMGFRSDLNSAVSTFYFLSPCHSAPPYWSSFHSLIEQQQRLLLEGRCFLIGCKSLKWRTRHQFYVLLDAESIRPNRWLEQLPSSDKIPRPAVAVSATRTSYRWTHLVPVLTSCEWWRGHKWLPNVRWTTLAEQTHHCVLLGEKALPQTTWWGSTCSRTSYFARVSSCPLDNIILCSV